MIVFIYMRTVKKYKESCQYWGSVTFWCGSGSRSLDPYHWPIDPTPFFDDLKDVKKLFFSYFFLITYPQVHHLQSQKFNFLPKFCFKILFCQALFSVRSRHFWEKGRIGSRIRIRTSDLWIRIREVQKHADPADPDPLH